METTILAFKTDRHQSYDSHRVVGVFSSKEKALEVCAKDEDLVADVNDDERLLVLEEYDIDTDSGSVSIFNTSASADKEEFLSYTK